MRHQWENFEKMTKDRNFDFLGAQSGPKIGPLRPIFSKHLKVLGMSMWSNTVVKPVKTFWESDQTSEIFLTLGPKMAQKLGLWDLYFTHLWKYLQCAYKARLMWIQTKLFNKIFENLNFDSFGGPEWPKIWASGASLLHTYKNSSNELVVNIAETFQENRRKPIYWPIFWGGPKIWPMEVIFLT